MQMQNVTLKMEKIHFVIWEWNHKGNELPDNTFKPENYTISADLGSEIIQHIWDQVVVRGLFLYLCI